MKALFFTAHSSFQIIAVYFTSQFVVILMELMIFEFARLRCFFVFCLVSTAWCLAISAGCQLIDEPVLKWLLPLFLGISQVSRAGVISP